MRTTYWLLKPKYDRERYVVGAVASYYTGAEFSLRKSNECLKQVTYYYKDGERINETTGFFNHRHIFDRVSKVKFLAAIL